MITAAAIPGDIDETEDLLQVSPALEFQTEGGCDTTELLTYDLNAFKTYLLIGTLYSSAKGLFDRFCIFR